ncbi:MAG: ATP-binding protein [Deltaproteobacteria bacterium]|nr:ATP-binding protein [Deltaproteobacteria bacterium]
MRYLYSLIEKDLKKKMVFLAGPRQVGKTTLAERIMKGFNQPTYLNWDNPEHRRTIQKGLWPQNTDLLVFDELHKKKNWKSWVKGIYDVEKRDRRILVTGSARLDVYRRGGDSLQGRYHHWRLHPFTLDENPRHRCDKKTLETLLEFGGFPEPFLSRDKVEAARWRRDRYERLIKEDVRDLEHVKDVQTLSLFNDLIRERVGSPVAVSNLAQDLEISPLTAKHWLSVMEAMYHNFVLRPFSDKIARSSLKQPKVYLYDTGEVQGDAAKAENLVACHLLKRVQFLQDAFGERVELQFIRDKDGNEVDFAIIRNRKVIELYEVKLSDDTIAPSLIKYQKMLQPQNAFQVVFNLDKPYERGGIKVLSPIELFQSPPWEKRLPDRAG